MTEVEFSSNLHQEHETLDQKEQQNDHEKATANENNFQQLLKYYSKLLLNTNDLFTTAVIGEINSGKSTFINALLGRNMLHSKSNSAIAFPLRIVHDVTHTDYISLKYFYDQKTINQLISLVNKHQVDKDMYLTILHFFSTTIKEEKDTLESHNVHEELEVLNGILRTLSEVENYPVEKLLTALVPEITINFKSFSLHGFVDLPSSRTFSNIPHRAVFIDTPGMEKSGVLNELFQWMIADICQKVDYNILVLDKGGRDSENEFKMVQMLTNSRSFSVVVSKLDDYHEDIKSLLTEEIPTRFSKCENLHKVYGISQNKFLIANIILDDFENNGAIVDTGESYIEKILQDVYGYKEIKSYRNKDENYEQYLEQNDDYMDVIENVYLHCEGQQFLSLIEDLHGQIYEEWKPYAIDYLTETTEKINHSLDGYLENHDRESMDTLKLTNKLFKGDEQAIGTCLSRCFTFESYDYIITKNQGKRMDNLENIQNIIDFNKPIIRQNEIPILKCDYKNVLWKGGVIIVPWLFLDVYYYGLNVSNIFAFIQDKYVNSLCLIAYIIFIAWVFYSDKSRQMDIAEDIQQAPNFSTRFQEYQKISEANNLKKVKFLINKILSFQ